jgi:hypothetical protein
MGKQELHKNIWVENLLEKGRDRDILRKDVREGAYRCGTKKW